MVSFDFDLPYAEVKVPGTDKTLRVRGLDFTGLTKLFRNFAAEVDMVFQRFDQLAVKGEDGEIAINMAGAMDLGLELIEKCPLFAAYIIALAADAPDEPEVRTKFQRLPFPVQIEALEHIAKLTFDGEDGPKKAVEVVTRALRAVRGQIQSVRGLPTD